MTLSIETQCTDELADVLESIHERGEDPMLYLLSYLHGYLEAATEGDKERVPFIIDFGGTGLRIEIIDDMDEYQDEELARVH